jgi:hypothetical protein
MLQVLEGQRASWASDMHRVSQNLAIAEATRNAAGRALLDRQMEVATLRAQLAAQGIEVSMEALSRPLVLLPE